MTDENEPTRRTSRGNEIPVPKRSTWGRLRRKGSHPRPESQDQAEAGSEKRAMEDEFWGEEPAP